MAKQLVGNKRRNECARILGKQVIAAFMNDNIPHGFAQAWVNEKTAYLINLKRRSYVIQILDGKVRIFKPRVFVKIGEVKPDVLSHYTEPKPSDFHTAGCIQRSFANNHCTCFQDKPMQKDDLHRLIEETEARIQRAKVLTGCSDDVARAAFEGMV